MALDPLDTVALTTCTDADLLAAQADVVVRRRWIEAEHAAIAGEIARRSAPDAGMAGLAQAAGDRTAVRFIERTAGVAADEARRLVAVGARITDTADPIGSAVVDGTLSIASASAISTELDRVIGDVPAEVVRAAESRLVARAVGLSAGDVRREARAVRDDLDIDGVPDREERLHRQRRLSLSALPTGMTRIDGLLDPESAALVTDAFDQALAPRRGGPRFVDPDAVDRAERIRNDPRTIEQLMVDTLVQIVRIAAAADPGEVFGSTVPAVRVHVAQRDLESGVGAASLEGQEAPVSVATAERLGCAGAQSILFDSAGAVLDLGREQRLYSRSQRRALAARDGGCRAPAATDRRRGPKRTTSTSGRRTGGGPTSPAECCCVRTIIDGCTRTDIGSSCGTGSTAWSTVSPGATPRGPARASSSPACWRGRDRGSGRDRHASGVSPRGPRRASPS